MTYQDKYTPEQVTLAQDIIAMEKAALAKFYQGDSTGYQELWDHDNFSYFDANTYERVDTYERIHAFLTNFVDNKVKSNNYQMVAPRVQFGQGAAILTYQLHTVLESFHNNAETHYNVIEIYQENADGKWTVVHSTWAPIRPFSTDDDEIII
ncbi:Calcium/calmodulin dependent protein kinase II association domain-containing protein [Streptococcus gallolyticus]|uniref:Calcium/calmodulin dependent protein kinase II association domain-containing protein n=1 Tax=Streptococcus gallolyticus TaxID=315405 RepID=A0A1I7FC11_9STRE|nr:DUF4440 domain-containing protein [Streptococcus gallolyticus]SFC05267.1 Calcium/calmodulin dependent protein kinase II association domain-containing protein [Streptococcus gallolyticus]SFU33738.1 Calcium/calmodulin dependent protein kinase II association domain-containing protein [Streptococcus gallolyticus]